MKHPNCPRCPLRRSAVFKPVDRATLSVIEKMKTNHQRVPAGREVIREGDADPRVYTLYSGWAFRYKTLSDGRRQILNFLMPGDLIGFQAQMFDVAPHAVQTLTEAELCVMSRRSIWNLFETSPELAFDATWLTAHEEGVVDDNLLTVGRRNATERIAALLMYLYRRARAIDLLEQDALALPITQAHIADALGLSLVHTNKSLRRLHHLNICHFSHGRLVMLDPHAMRTMADYFDSPVGRRPLI